MKQVFQISIIVLIISILLSCDKEDPTPPTIVNGQVLEQGTNKPLEGVKVVLMEGTYNGFGSGTYSYYPIDTVLTDKEGKYSYNNLIKGDLKDYVLWFYKDQYFSITDSRDEIDVAWNKTITPTSKMYPFAWLTVRVINEKPFDSSDKIHVLGPWEAGGLDYMYIGKNTNITFTKKTEGGRKSQIAWWVYKNNTNKFYEDSINIKPHDTTYYQIKY
jgi:hypothetical protein